VNRPTESPNPKGVRLPSAGRSFGGMFILRIASQLVTLATIIQLSRFLGPDGFGRYSFLYSGLFLILTLFNVNGLNDILARDLSANPEERNRIYQNGLALKLIAGGLAFIIAVILILTTDWVNIPKPVACFGALTLFVSFTIGSFRQVWDVPYQVDFRMIPASLVNFSGRILFLVSLSAIQSYTQMPIWISNRFNPQTTVSLSKTLTVIIIVQTLVEITAMIGLGALNRKYHYPMLPKWNPKTLRYLIIQSWPLAAAGGFVMIYSKVNVLLLQVFLSERNVGLYAAPMRIADALVIIPTVFMVSAMPILSVFYKESRQKFDTLVALSFRLMFLCSLAAGAIAVFYSKPLMELLYSAEYSSAALVMAVLVGGTLFTFGSILLSGIMVVAGEQKLLMTIYALQTVINLGLNIWLIPKFGITGAAAAFVFTYFCIFSLILLWRRVRHFGVTWFKVLILPLISAFIAGLSVKLFHFSLIPAMIIIPAVFMAFFWIFGGWKKDDFALLKEMMTFRSGTVQEKADPDE
jgi:O-antigen/teichoic acid export membrane protein